MNYSQKNCRSLRQKLSIVLVLFSVLTQSVHAEVVIDSVSQSTQSGTIVESQNPEENTTTDTVAERSNSNVADGSGSILNVHLDTGSLTGSILQESQDVQVEQTTNVSSGDLPMIPSETGVKRIVLPNSVGIIVSNAETFGGGLTVIQSPLHISADSQGVTGKQSVAVDFAYGRKFVHSITLETSDTFVGSLLLLGHSNIEGAEPRPMKTVTLTGSVTSPLQVRETISSFILVVRRGTAIIKDIDVENEVNIDPQFALTPTAEVLDANPEEGQIILDDIVTQRDSLISTIQFVQSGSTTLSESVLVSEQSLSALESVLSTMRSQLVEEQQNFATTRNRVDTIPREIEAHTRTRDALQQAYDADLPRLQLLVQNAMNAVALAESGVVVEARNVREIEEQLRVPEQSLHEAQVVLQRALQTASGAMAAVSIAQISITTATTNQSKAQEAYTAATKKRPRDPALVASTLGALNAAKKLLSEANTALKNASRTLSSANNSVRIARSSVEAKERAIAPQRSYLQYKRSVLEGAQRTLATAQENLDSARANVLRPLQPIEREQDAITRLQDELASLLPTLQSQSGAVLELSAHLSSATTEQASLVQSLGQLRLQLAQSQSYLTSLRAFHTALEQQVTIAQVAHERAVKVLDSRRAQLEPILTKLAELESDAASVKNSIEHYSATGSLASILSVVESMYQNVSTLEVKAKVFDEQIGSHVWMQPARTKLGTVQESIARAFSALTDLTLELVQRVEDETKLAEGPSFTADESAMLSLIASGSVLRNAVTAQGTRLAEVRSLIGLASSFSPSSLMMFETNILQKINESIGAIQSIVDARTLLDRLLKETLPIDIAVWGKNAMTQSGALGSYTFPGGGNAYKVVISPDGKYLLHSSEKSPEVIVFDAKTATKSSMNVVPTGARIQVAAAWSPTGEIFATGGYDGILKIWSPGVSAPLATLKLGGGVFEIAFSPTGEKIVAIAGAKVVIIDTSIFNVTHTFTSTEPRFPKFFSDGITIGFINRDKLVTINSKTGVEKSVLLSLSHGVPTSLEISSDSWHAYVGTLYGRIHIINALSGSLMSTYSLPSSPTLGSDPVDAMHLDFANRLFVGTFRGNIYLFEHPETTTESPKFMWTTSRRISHMVTSPSAKTLLVLNGADGTGNSDVQRYPLTPPLLRKEPQNTPNNILQRKRVLSLWNSIETILSRPLVLTERSSILADFQAMFTQQNRIETVREQVGTTELTQSQQAEVAQAKLSLNSLFAKHAQSDTVQWVTSLIASGGVLFQTLKQDARGVELLAEVVMQEANNKVLSSSADQLTELYIQLGEARQNLSDSFAVTMSDSVLHLLEGEKQKLTSSLILLGRQSTRTNAEIVRRNALQNSAVTPYVEINQDFDLQSHLSIETVKSRIDERVTKKTAPLEADLLGGTLLVTTLHGDTKDAFLERQTDGAGNFVGLKSTGKATVLDFTKLQSSVVGGRIHVKADSGVTLIAHYSRKEQTVKSVNLGTGRVIEFSDPESVTALLIEQVPRPLSKEANDWREYDRFYELYTPWDQLKDIDYEYFERLKPHLFGSRNSIKEEAYFGPVANSLTIESISLRANAASLPLQTGPLTSLLSAKYSELSVPYSKNSSFPYYNFTDNVPYVANEYNVYKLVRYSNSPVFGAAGSVRGNEKMFPFDSYMLDDSSTIMAVPPYAQGIYRLGIQVFGGTCFKNHMRSTDSFDCRIQHYHGMNPSEFMPPKSMKVEVGARAYLVNESGTGWFDGMTGGLPSKTPTAIDPVKVKIAVNNVSSDSGPITVNVYSGSPGVEGWEALVWSSTSSIAPSSQRGVWTPQIPLRGDSSGNAYVRIVVTKSDGSTVGEGGVTLRGLYGVTQEQKAANEALAMQKQLDALARATTDTKLYYASMGITHPATTYDWNVIAENYKLPPSSPIPPELGERLIRAAVRSKTSAVASGDSARIAQSERQVASTLTVYAAALTYAQSPLATSTPAQLLVFISNEILREDAKQSIQTAYANTLEILSSKKIATSNNAKQLDLISNLVAAIPPTSDARFTGSLILPKLDQALHLGEVPSKDGSNPISLDIQGKNDRKDVTFTLNERTMFNVWVNASELTGNIFESTTAIRKDVSFKLKKNNDQKFVEKSSEKMSYTSAESLSLILEKGTYTLTVYDQSTYFTSYLLNPSNLSSTLTVPLHFDTKPLRTQKITGRMSIENRPDALPISMSVAEFDEESGKRLLLAKNGLNPNLPVWVVVHGRENSEDSDNIKDLTKALYEFDNANSDAYQTVTIDWELASKDNSFLFNGGVLDLLRDATWTPAVGKWVATQLAQANYNGENINFAGHSHGTYVSYFAAKEFNTLGKGVTHSIIALDPATNVQFLNGGNSIDETKIKFAQVAQTTVSIKAQVDSAAILRKIQEASSTIERSYWNTKLNELAEYGNDRRAKTAHTALELKVVGETEREKAHGYPVTAFADLIRKSINNIDIANSSIGLKHILTTTKGIKSIPHNDVDETRDFDGEIKALSFEDTIVRNWWKSMAFFIDFDDEKDLDLDQILPSQ